ncbi:programmed cell death 2 like trus [Arctopsyche grandis]|uniref:programmed cell death 2 like trus n=1 Tax=Arctopsyche grandis TaxID=121162 RepID=UPI00406D7528
MSHVLEVQLGAADGEASPGATTCYDSKLGGLPDWPSPLVSHFNNACKLCGLSRPLVFQCYAPFENSPYHRTVYIYGCINPNCWNNSESWSCIRVQYKDENKNVTTESTTPQNNVVSDMWCTDANNWEEDEMTSNTDESSTPQPCNSKDEIMEEISHDFGNLNCTNVHSRLHELQKIANETPQASANIEIDGSSQVIVETPTFPVNDIRQILNQKPDLPAVSENTSIQFKSIFVRVYPENFITPDKDRHIDELLLKYQQDMNIEMQEDKTKVKKNNVFVNEEYEKETPLHGDTLFHSFLTRIKMNPEQIVRYSLGQQPLLISELPNNIKALKCQNCLGNVQFELQILPTVIPHLRIAGSNQTHLEFGNVIVYTCKNSCWKNDEQYVSEIVIVQAERILIF